MLKKSNIPQHIAIIMDGNGRWAKKRHLPRTAGHARGVQTVEKIIQASLDFGVKVLTLYAFSTENWLRPKKEVNMLLKTLDSFLKSRFNKMMKSNIQFRFMGEVNQFPSHLRDLLLSTRKRTENNTGLVLNLALNYGSRYEILEAAKKIAKKIQQGSMSIGEINEDTFSGYLYTSDLPDPDLLIRTSGERRLSNFMLWQLSYAEFYFINKFWPEFGKKDLELAISDYKKRERRFGGIHASA